MANTKLRCLKCDRMSRSRTKCEWCGHPMGNIDHGVKGAHLIHGTGPGSSRDQRAPITSESKKEANKENREAKKEANMEKGEAKKTH